MTINKKIDNGILVVSLEGRLDTTTSPMLETELSTAMADIKTLVFDFKKLEYISSAGLRVLLASQKKMNKTGGNMEITNVNEAIMEVLNITGFADILTIK